MKTTTETATRFIGNCQLCEADQKVNHGLMVHHGYRRPGDGYIFGDCPGVHVAPYEVSCEAIKSWKVQMETQLGNQKVYLARLQNGEVQSFIEGERTHVAAGRYEDKMVTYDHATTPKYKWESLLRSRIWNAERNVRATEATITRCAERIAAWTAKPVRTIEEEKVMMDMAKAERSVVVAARRAAKEAKQAATKAKQAALEARRQAIREDFIARFRALSETEESLERTNAAGRLANEMTKTKYSFLYVQELRIEDVLIDLGLAERDDSGWVKYAYNFYR